MTAVPVVPSYPSPWTAATFAWQPDTDGWLYRQQQWGEPSDFGHPYAFVSRGVIHARGWALAAMVDQIQQEQAA